MKEQDGSAGIAAAAAAGTTCALCGVPVGDGAPLAGGQPVCPSCASNVRQELEAERGMGTFPVALAVGAAGAAIGAAVWAAIVVLTNFEVGYVAVGVGFLAGVGVKFGAGKARNQMLQVAAALLAVGGLVLAKYFIFAHFVSQIVLEDGGGTIGWFDPGLIQAFPGALMEISSPFDILWIVLAVSAAYRVPAPSGITFTG